MEKKKPTLKKLVEELTEEEVLAILYDWRLWARPNQLPPEGDWFEWLLLSGRGFGKTRVGLEAVISWAKKGYGPIAIVGETARDVRDTLIEVHDSSLLKISPPWFMPEYEPSKQRVIWPNGVVGSLYYGDTPDQLRGPQHAKAFVDELAKFRYPQLTWDNLIFGLRQGSDPQVVTATTPRPIPIIKNMVKEAEDKESGIVVTKGSTFDNAANLPKSFIRTLVRKYEGTRIGLQELEAKILEDNPEALWERESIEKHRVNEHPGLARVVVAVDPEAKSTKDSSETGIIAAGRVFGSEHCFVLGDLSLKDKPAKWGRAVVSGYNIFMADFVVGEVNNGGEMVEHVLRTVEGGKDVPYVSVHASRGKETRAQPIASAYAAGLVHHVGYFAELEDQMCEWIPGVGKSPDRVDALVWALTFLGIGDEINAGKAKVGSKKGLKSRYG